MRPVEVIEMLLVRDRQRSAEAGEESAAPRKSQSSGEERVRAFAVRYRCVREVGCGEGCRRLRGHEVSGRVGQCASAGLLLECDEVKRDVRKLVAREVDLLHKMSVSISSRGPLVTVHDSPVSCRRPPGTAAA